MRGFVRLGPLDDLTIQIRNLLVEPMKRGLISWDRIHELSEVVAEKVTGRTNADDITLFKSHGIAIEDVAVAALVYERARDRGIGRPISL